MGDNDSADPKVKDLIERGAPIEEVVDAATAEALQRWFGLPSFEAIATAAPPPADDPAVIAIREQREKALAAVEPAMLDGLARRHGSPDAMLCWKPSITLRVDPSCAMIDFEMIDRGHTIAEPRLVEIPPELQDDLHECTPQALLRDLHRAEIDFHKVFEIVDVAAEQRFDIVAAVDDAMATSWRLPELGESPFREAQVLMAELRDQRRRPWTDIPRPNRRVVDEP